MTERQAPEERDSDSLGYPMEAPEPVAAAEAAPVPEPLKRRDFLKGISVALGGAALLAGLYKLNEPENTSENPKFIECKKRKDKLQKDIDDFFAKYEIKPTDFPAKGLNALAFMENERTEAYQALKFKVEEFWKYIDEVAKQKDTSYALMEAINRENDELTIKTKVPVPYGEMYTNHLSLDYLRLCYEYFQAYDSFLEKVKLEEMDKVLNSKGTTLLFVTTEALCGSCMDSTPSMAVFAEQYKDLAQIKSVVIPRGGYAQSVATFYPRGIELEGLPALILVVDGKIIGTLEGGFTNPETIVTFAHDAMEKYKISQTTEKFSGTIPSMPLREGLYQ